MTLRSHSFLLMVSFFITNHFAIHTIDTTVAEYAQLHLPKIPKQFYFHDHTAIHLSTPTTYQETMQKWQNKLAVGAINIFDQIEQEINISFSELQEYTHDEQILQRYHFMKKAELILPNPESIISQDEMDPEILQFLQSIFFKYTNKRNVTFFLTDQLSSLTATYGSDIHGHYVFCHSYIYTKEHIQQYYQTLQNKRGYYYIETYNDTDIRWIEIPSLLQSGLIEAASNVQHQKNLLSFILSNYSFQGKRISKQCMQRYMKLETFHSLLEVVFQAKNPLEVVIFLMKTNEESSQYFAMWHIITQDIAKCYHKKSLHKFKDFSQQIKKANSQD